MVFVTCVCFLFCIFLFVVFLSITVCFFLLFLDASVNLALNKAASQISIWQVIHYLHPNASLAVDGNRAQNFFGGHCTHTTGIANPWWMVDLGRMESVSKVYVVNWDHQWFQYLIDFELKIGELVNNDRSIDDRPTNLELNISEFYEERLRNYELKIGDIYDEIIVRLSRVT